MPKKRDAAEEKLRKLELEKLATKEAIQEFLDKKWERFKGDVGAWVIRTAALLVFAGIVKLFFYAVKQGWIKAEDVIK